MQAEPPRKTFDGRFDVLSRWRFVEPQNETWTFAKLQPAKANEWRRCQKLWSQSSCHVRASVTTCRSCPFSYLYFISFSRLSPCGPKCPRAACSTITGLSRFLLFFLKRLGYRWYDMISGLVDAGCKVWVDSTSKSTVRHISREWQVWNFKKHL